MKTKIILSILILSIAGTNYVEAKNGDGWKKFARGLGNLFSAAGSALMYESCVASGYTEEQSKKLVTDACNAFGMNSRNTELGIAYIEADNKYEKQNVAKEFAFDVAADMANNPEFVEKFRTMTDAQLTYLSDKTKATTKAEEKQAFDKRTIAYANLFYDTYQEAKERKSKHVAKKLEIEQQLVERGYTDPNVISEVAGSIVALEKSDLPEEEKEKILRSFGLRQSPDEIREIAREAETMDDSESGYYTQYGNEVKTEKEKKEEKEKLEKEQKEKEEALRKERNDAIEMINKKIISGFPFDKTELSDKQKIEMDSIGIILNKYTDLNINITGHTCRVGYKSINMRKGMERAESAKQYLMDKGIEASRISTESKGESNPISNTYSLNRRIDFKIKTE